jgi:hypothetical protein
MWHDDLDRLAYSYFNLGSYKETMEGTYAQKDAQLSLTNVFWNHPLSEVHSALNDAGLQVVDFQEYAHSPYDVLKGMEQESEWVYRQREWKDGVPYVYSILAVKPE